MEKKDYNTAGFTFTAFSLLSGLAQTLSLPLAYSIPTIGLTVILASFALFFFRKANQYKKTMKNIENLLGKPVRDYSGSRFSTRKIRNEAEVRELVKIDEEIFGDEAFSYKQRRELWNTYPDGSTIVIDENDGIIGSLGLWPLKKSTFLNIMNGKKSGKELTHHSLFKQRTDFTCATWYLSGIILAKKYRKTEALPVLITGAIQSWLSSGRLENPLTICAEVYSIDGENLLKKFGFSKYKEANETLGRMPIFLLTINSTDEIGSILYKKGLYHLPTGLDANAK
jgi:hypothetical protein